MRYRSANGSASWPARASIACAIVAGAGPLLATCAGEARSAATVERSDSAGIALVVNSGEDRPLDWRFEKVLDLGGADEGPQAFHRVFATSVGTDAAGRIYVLDAGNHTVTVFDGDGTVVRTMGARGGGPGELRFPSDLGVADDGTAAVWDFDKAGFVRFAPDGSILPEVRMVGALQRQLALTSLGIVAAFREFRGESDAGETQLIAQAGADTLVFARQVHESQAMVQLDCMAFAMAPLLSPGIVWSARDDRVIVNDGVGFDLAVYTGEGLAARWRRSGDPIPSSVAHAAAELGTDSMRMMAGDFRCAVPVEEAAEKIGYAGTVPVVRSIAIARDGQVWVQRRTGTARELRTDILLDDGSYLGTLPATAPFPAAFLGENRIVVVERDALDLAHVVVYRIERT